MSCTADDPVREYFQSHEMTYPADVSGIEMLGIRYVGITRDELTSDEARDFVQDGVMSAKEFFMKEDAGSLMPGITAVIAESPVLFRDENAAVGLMVKVTGYGKGKPDNRIGLQVEWMGKDKRIWKVINFAYFNRNELYNWQFGGWVY
ncbi:MAG: hypothetical protein AB1499_03035 [Nitrospirota bacterium]